MCLGVRNVLKSDFGRDTRGLSFIDGCYSQSRRLRGFDERNNRKCAQAVYCSNHHFRWGHTDSGKPFCFDGRKIVRGNERSLGSFQADDE